ncbi:hypothetical protein CEXT_545451 [Caerostris extrusa]|uniref:Uncharacterized protein n=1 Tax=Caerostris extrusa TaxID=172846 RepID=A0AAV4W3J8_CAEEX|nr:hypothetical protein CEXT_545451 [Caerostris extrusa]
MRANNGVLEQTCLFDKAAEHMDAIYDHNRSNEFSDHMCYAPLKIPSCITVTRVRWTLMVPMQTTALGAPRLRPLLCPEFRP